MPTLRLKAFALAASVGTLEVRSYLAELHDPSVTGDMHGIGTIANVVRYVTAPDGAHHLVCQGDQRFRIVDFLSGWPFLVARVLRIPEPNPGTPDIPLSRPMVRCIIRAIRWGRIMYSEQAQSWLFPADSETGHIVEHKEERCALSKWGNDLRQSYRTLAQAAGVSELDIHLLMNHSLPGVNAGYITRDRLLRDHLRQQQQGISQLVVRSSAAKRDRSMVRWLGSAKIEETAGQTEAGAKSEIMSMAA
jgi:hypothetical protein